MHILGLIFFFIYFCHYLVLGPAIDAGKQKLEARKEKIKYQDVVTGDGRNSGRPRRMFKN